jgi:non-canonical (house-cleaning) NTP pyrophosphatase
MKIGVTSEKSFKIEAVKKAYSLLGVPVIGYKTNSGVGEQPENEQTILGARNRILDLRSQVSDFDRIVSIENGIFFEGGKWADRAVVIVYNPHTDAEYIGYSDAVVFPTEFVERARKIGFDKITIGQVMAQAGFVANPNDPHLTISGISRQVYLENVVREVVQKCEGLK